MTTSPEDSNPDFNPDGVVLKDPNKTYLTLEEFKALKEKEETTLGENFKLSILETQKLLIYKHFYNTYEKG